MMVDVRGVLGCDGWCAGLDGVGGCTGMWLIGRGRGCVAGGRVGWGLVF